MLNCTKLFTLFLLLALLLSACGESEPYSPFAGMNFIKEYGWKNTDNLMACPFVDLNTVEAVTEYSCTVILGEVTAIHDVVANEMGDFVFYYTVAIQEVLYDRDQNKTVGEELIVSSTEGVLLANEAKALLANSLHAKKYGILQGEYGENDYIRCSYYDAIPIQVGETYLMYLTDRYYAEEAVYAEIGQQYLYLCRDNTLYGGREGEKLSVTLPEMKKQVEKQMAQRTGRADEIGHNAFLYELGEKQAAERKAQREAQESSKPQN